MEVKDVKEVGIVMENRRLSPKARLIFGAVSIVGLLLFSGLLANAVRESSARQSNATMAQNRLNTMILTIRADVAASMLHAHDFLITPSPVERKEFLESSKQIALDFNVLQIDQHFEAIDHKIIDQAFEQFKKLEKVQEEIFALRGAKIKTEGPAKMKTMHVYQDAILDKLGALNNLESAEYENLILMEQEDNRRSVTLIAASAALALGGALLVGFLASKT